MGFIGGRGWVDITNSMNSSKTVLLGLVGGDGLKPGPLKWKFSIASRTFTALG